MGLVQRRDYENSSIFRVCRLLVQYSRDFPTAHLVDVKETQKEQGDLGKENKGETKMTIPTKLNSKAKSEHGKGLVICLVKFAEHAENWPRFRDEYATMRERCPDGFNESTAVGLFFYGASDHLSEIEVPKKWRGTIIESKVRELQNLAFTSRYGFIGPELSEEDVIRACDLCREIALLIDKDLGLSPDIGKY